MLEGFHSLLRREAIVAADTEKPLSLVIFDLDCFARFNKEHGEQIGDQALKCVAKVLGSVLKSGTTARYGGEEFAAILIDTTLADAVAQANEVREILATHQLVSSATGKRYEPLTLSAGAAHYEVGHPLVGMIERAETALKKAKAQGRNRVVADS